MTFLAGKKEGIYIYIWEKEFTNIYIYINIYLYIYTYEKEPDDIFQGNAYIEVIMSINYVAKKKKKIGS